MALLKTFSITFFFTSSFLIAFFFTSTQATTFNITNQCPYTVWAAAVPRGGGKQLNSGESWAFDVAANTKGGIWARTGCSFDGSGHGKCETGDCGGLLQCQVRGLAPYTVAIYLLNEVNNSDIYGLGLIKGFNIPMEFSPTSNGCTRGITCTSDIIGQCPKELRTQGGCNDPCTVFKTDQYCCQSERCGPTDYSKFFKDRCSDTISYPMDNQADIFKCPTGTNYRVVFCPSSTSLFI